MKTLELLMAAGLAVTNPIDYIGNSAIQLQESQSSGLIERVKNEGVRRALEPFREIKDEVFSTQDFTLTLSAYANNEQIFPSVQIKYAGSQPVQKNIKIKFVLCAASLVNDKWQGNCFMPMRRSEQLGPFQPQESRKAEPKQPLSYPYANNPVYVLLPHARIEIADEQIDLGTLIGKNVEIAPRK